MTIIRAHVPVETPAGLVVALPPCKVCADLKAIGVAERACTRHPDVFDLAVPCPTCHGDYSYRECEACGNGRALYGRYRVLEVLHRIRRTNLYPEHADAFSLLGDRSHIVIDHADLPAAVPGGVALIVEAVK
jgi:hypothetical protein